MATLYDNYNDNWASTYSLEILAQTFTASATYTVTSIKVKISDGYGLSIPVQLQAVDGEGHPSGTYLCSGILTPSGNDLDWYEVTMSAGGDLTIGTKYAVVLDNTGNPSIAWAYMDGDPFAGGNAEGFIDGAWSALTDFDFNFEVWGVPTAPPVYRTANYVETVQDKRGKPIFMAECKAFTYAGELLETQYSNNGIATFTQIPVDVPVYIESRWGRRGYQRTDNIFCSSAADILTMVTQSHAQNTDAYTKGVQVTTVPAGPPAGRWYVG
jgi:hypothetical protein